MTSEPTTLSWFGSLADKELEAHVARLAEVEKELARLNNEAWVLRARIAALRAVRRDMTTAIGDQIYG